MPVAQTVIDLPLGVLTFRQSGERGKNAMRRRLLRYFVYVVVFYSVVISIPLLLTLHNNGFFRRYSIEDVTHVLYEAGLLSTRHLTMTVDPEDSKRVMGGLETYSFTIEGPHLSEAYYAEILIFPSQWPRKRVQRRYAEIHEAFGTKVDVFVKGNVMLVVDPALPEAEAEKYRRAFESLGLGFFF
jgi:hypothetical protein